MSYVVTFLLPSGKRGEFTQHGCVSESYAWLLTILCIIAQMSALFVTVFFLFLFYAQQIEPKARRPPISYGSLERYSRGERTERRR